MTSRIPFLLIPIAIYNLVVVFFYLSALGGGPADFDLSRPWLVIGMNSPHSEWHISLGDILILAGLICLFWEVLKSTNTNNATLMNHTLSMFVFIGGFVEFLLFRPFATSAFFLLVVMTAMDVLAGFIITTIGARKDIGA